jgi:hypothetical protein
MRYYDPAEPAIDPWGYTGFYEYATPVGSQLRAPLAGHATLSVSVDRDCTPWTICVHDSGGPASGIRYIELLGPSETINSIPVNYQPNGEFDASVDPLHLGEIDLDGTRIDYCFAVRKRRQQDTTDATVAIYENSGVVAFVDLQT